ncbi:MAG: hypothetical protein U9Q70_09670 [Chloroflexota bacterium]|nr:hypothetical protein [Chloroflexota bacterium]
MIRGYTPNLYQSLTNGIANRGVTDPDRIAADALAYNEKGIYLSAIGLGLEFNDALLSQLAHQGQGGYGRRPGGLPLASSLKG